MLRAEMPGVDKDDFDIQIDGDELTIKGKRKPMDSGLTLIHGETDHADYLRSFTLGDQVDASKVEAKLSHGILTLTLRKKEEVLPRKITVKAE